MIVWLLIAAAVALLAIPVAKPIPNPFSKPEKSSAIPSYMDSIAALQLVRNRLIGTEKLSDEQQAAIDCLALSLVGGSDK